MPTLATHPGIRWTTEFISIGPRVRKAASTRRTLPSADDGVLVGSLMGPGKIFLEVRVEDRTLRSELHIADQALLLRADELLNSLIGKPMKDVRATPLS